MIIKKITGEIFKVIDLSSTAKEVHVHLSENIDFLPGSFLNVFLNIDGEIIRRAYSISSSELEHNNITFTIRLSPNGIMTPYIWNNNIIGKKVDIMGPLGLNTVDKMNHKKIYLFAFGVGVGVVKSIADHFSNYKKVDQLTIITGSRSEDEILYKEYFESLSKKHSNVSILNVVSQVNEGSTIPKGYIQDYISDFDFNNSDVYVCGQEKACNDLVGKVNILNPVDCSLFVEGFH